MPMWQIELYSRIQFSLIHICFNNQCMPTEEAYSLLSEPMKPEKPNLLGHNKISLSEFLIELV